MKKIFVITLLLFGFIIQSKAQSTEKIAYEAKDGGVQKVKLITTKEVISKNIEIPTGFTAKEVAIALNEGKNLIRYDLPQIENTFPFYTVSSNKHEYKWIANISGWAFLGLSSKILSPPKMTGFFLGLFLLICTSIIGCLSGVLYWVRTSESIISKLDTRANAVFSAILVTIAVSIVFSSGVFFRNGVSDLDSFVSTYYTWVSFWVLNFVFSFGVIFFHNREYKNDKLRNEEIKKEAERYVELLRSQ